MVRARHPKTDSAAAKGARRKRAQGKKPSTQAGEFIHEEMHHMKSGEHGGRRAIQNRRQAIAIGLAKARRHGVAVPPRPSRKRKSA